MLVEPSSDAGDEGCRYKHRGENQGNGDDGTGEFFHRLPSGIFWSKTLLDMALYAFDDNDGVIYDEADRQDQPEHRKRVDREAKEREENKRTYQRDGNGQQRDQCSAPVLQKKVDHQDHQNDGNQQGDNELLHAFCNCARLVKRYGVIHILWEALLHLGHQFSDACGRLDGVGTRQLINGNDDGGLAIQAADNAVVLCAQLDAGDIFDANNAAIRRLAHDHVFELFRGR